MPITLIDPSVHEPIGGVLDPRRLAAVARAELHGHLGDQDLNAVVATLRIGCRVPIAVINIVSHNLQTYPAEVGVGAPCTRVPDALSFCARVVDTKSAVTVPDARAHPVYAHNPMVLGGVIGAYAGVPLVDRGFVLGSVSIFDGRAREFTSEELLLLDLQARLASSVLALRRASRTDVLTGLPNRGLFLDRLDHALTRLARHPGLAAVMYLDVDGFKGLNDSFGHDVGDWVLVELAARISAVMRPQDTLARLGGDEFGAVCEDIASARDAVLIPERIIAAVNEDWMLDGQRISVGLSLGIALADSSETDPAGLLRDADAAMYRAKRLAGSGWQLAHSLDTTRPVASEQDPPGH